MTIHNWRSRNTQLLPLLKAHWNHPVIDPGKVFLPLDLGSHEWCRWDVLLYSLQNVPGQFQVQFLVDLKINWNILLIIFLFNIKKKEENACLTNDIVFDVVETLDSCSRRRPPRLKNWNPIIMSGSHLAASAFRPSYRTNCFHFWC